MTDPQSWQREWARQLREENRWRRKALHRQPGELQARIAEKVPETVRDTLTAAFGAAFSAALAGEPLLRRTASPKAEARRLARAEEQLRTPERFSSVRGTGRSAVFSAAAASAVRGSGLGLLGIGLPDIPLFAASLLRSLGQIARGYGYITSTRKERRIMLLVLDAALTGGMEYPALSDQLDQALSGTELTGLSEQELADRVAGKLAEELLAAKSSGNPAGRRCGRCAGQPPDRPSAGLCRPQVQPPVPAGPSPGRGRRTVILPRLPAGFSAPEGSFFAFTKNICSFIIEVTKRRKGGKAHGKGTGDPAL